MEQIGVYCPSNEIALMALDSNEGLEKQFDIEDISEWSKMRFDRIWGRHTTAPLALVILIFPLVNLKSVTFFTKLNSLGTISILSIAFCVLYRSFKWGLNFDFRDHTRPDYIPLFKTSFPSLSGLLSLGLFVHNAIINIMSTNATQKNNGRDLACGYLLAMMTYLIVGVGFLLTFPLAKNCIEDNLLNNFRMHDSLNMITTIFLLLQMLFLFPLIMYLLRVTLFIPVFKMLWPGLKYVLFLNFLVIVLCVTFSMFLPEIGTIARFSGAACGMKMIFLLPVLVHLKSNKKDGALSWTSLVLHTTIIAIGAGNFVA